MCPAAKFAMYPKHVENYIATTTEVAEGFSPHLASYLSTSG